MSEEVSKLLRGCAVIMGGMTGYLIGLPIDVLGAVALPVTPIFAIGGLLVGWRRRRSRLFLYFALGCVMFLSTLISFSLIPH